MNVQQHYLALTVKENIVMKPVLRKRLHYLWKKCYLDLRRVGVANNGLYTLDDDLIISSVMSIVTVAPYGVNIFSHHFVRRCSNSASKTTGWLFWMVGSFVTLQALRQALRSFATLVHKVLTKLNTRRLQPSLKKNIVLGENVTLITVWKHHDPGRGVRAGIFQDSEENFGHAFGVMTG